jgi:hypothetical protein
MMNLTTRRCLGHKLAGVSFLTIHSQVTGPNYIYLKDGKEKNKRY